MYYSTMFSILEDWHISQLCRSYRPGGDFNLEPSDAYKEVAYGIYHEEGAAVTLSLQKLQGSC